MTTRFTDLTEIAAVDVDDADVLALSDVSASASRKVTVSSLRTTVGAPSQDQATWNTGTDTTESTITAAKLTAKITNDVPAVIASLSAGAVGTYVFATMGTTTETAAFGETRAGSGLFPTSTLESTSTGTLLQGTTASALSGTWRCLGDARSTANTDKSTLWLRIS